MRYITAAFRFALGPRASLSAERYWWLEALHWREKWTC